MILRAIYKQVCSENFSVLITGFHWEDLRPEGASERSAASLRRVIRNVKKRFPCLTW
jgi:hypothetical protein